MFVYLSLGSTSEGLRPQPESLICLVLLASWAKVQTCEAALNHNRTPFRKWHVSGFQSFGNCSECTATVRKKTNRTSDRCRPMALGALGLENQVC